MLYAEINWPYKSKILDELFIGDIKMNSYIGLSGSFDVMRSLNIEKVYKLILLNHPVSRSKISQLSGLNKATVGNCISFLLEQGIVHEIGITDAQVGRPSALIEIKGDSGVFIGIEMDILASRILVTNLSGLMLDSFLLSDTGQNPDSFLKKLADTIINLKQIYQGWRLGVVGVGIALPGHYNNKTGIIEFMANRQTWNGFPIRKELLKYHLGVPLYIQFAVPAGAMGEIHFGKSNPCEHLAYISGTWGIGASMYSNGILYTGYQGFAGRFGHSIIQANGRKCVCGNRGCLEEYASMRALVKKLYPERHLHYECVVEILERLKKEDPVTLEAINEIAEYLAIGITNVVNAYNPSQVCIGGYLGLLLNNQFLTEIKRIVTKMLPEHYRRNLHIYCSNLGELCVAYGCVAIVRDNLINIIINRNE